MKQTVFVVDDDEAVRDALKMLFLASELHVNTFPSAAAFLQSYRLDQRGCLVLDVRMPGTSGLVLQDELVKRHIKLPVVFLTGHADVPIAVHAMKKGAFDFIEKPIAALTLVPVIIRALQFDLEQRHQSHPETVNRSAEAKLLGTLSQREEEVLRLVLNGKSSRMIGEQLNITIKTVEFHRANIREKLDVSSMAELFRLFNKSDDNL